MFNVTALMDAEYCRNMQLQKETIDAAYKRNMQLQKKHRQALATLPRGSIVSKNVKGYEYFYWVYRDQGKVVTRYISAKTNNIPMLYWDVRRRRLTERALRSLKKEQIVLERLLRLAGNGPLRLAGGGPLCPEDSGKP